MPVAATDSAGSLRRVLSRRRGTPAQLVAESAPIGRAVGQSLRPDRGDHSASPGRTRLRIATSASRPDRHADLEHAGRTCWTIAAPGACGSGRRAVHRRVGPGAGISRPAGSDGGAVRGRSVRGRGQPDVPHRRPGRLAGGRDPGVPRPGRCPGQDPRLPDRAGRSRGGPGVASCRGPGGGAGPRGPAGTEAAGRLCRRPGRRDGRAAGVAPARRRRGCRSTWCRRRWWRSTRCR